jgi:hypothetical protein
VSGVRRIALLLALLFVLDGAAIASDAPNPTLLAWGDDPPALEVRGLAGARSIVVRYGALAPASFYAELDGELVTALFHPEPNRVETVVLPFIGGRNALRIGASSADGLEHVTLERVVVFARLPSDADADPATLMPSAPELRHALWKQQTPEAAPNPAVSPAAAPTTGAEPTKH